MEKYYIESVCYDSKKEDACIESSDIIYETSDKELALAEWKKTKDEASNHLNKGFGYTFYKRNSVENCDECLDECNYYTFN